jgi:hypothetical protein
MPEPVMPARLTAGSLGCTGVDDRCWMRTVYAAAEAALLHTAIVER